MTKLFIILVIMLFGAFCNYVLTFATVYGKPGKIIRDIAEKSVFFNELLSCPICTGTWISFIISLYSLIILSYHGFSVYEISIYFIPLWLAIAGINAFMWFISHLRTDSITDALDRLTNVLPLQSSTTSIDDHNKRFERDIKNIRFQDEIRQMIIDTRTIGCSSDRKRERESMTRRIAHKYGISLDLANDFGRAVAKGQL
jgi:hypothetical protein